MRQQLENTDPVEKGFFGPVFVADLLDEKEPLMSSFVVWLELIKYVWNPAKPRIDQTEKKQMTSSIIEAGVCLTASKKLLLLDKRVMCVMTEAKMKTQRQARETMNM